MRLDDDSGLGDDIRDLGRGGGGGGFGGGGGGGLGGLLFAILPMLMGRKMGCGTILILGAAAFILLGPGANMLRSGGGGTADPAIDSRGGAAVACDTEAERFACNVFRSTHTVWGGLINGYQKPTLSFYENSTRRSGCGPAQSAMGPFYCPADQGVYLDTSFFRELDQKFGAAGDAAQAYVIAHEVGHHIQTVSGISDQVRRAQQRASQAEGNALQVRMELQADCYAGVWAARAKTRDGQSVMEPGDMEEAMRAANAIGDDTLMRSAGQRPVPESFTHGTSEQRMTWLRRGLQTGDPRQCDAFGQNI